MAASMSAVRAELRRRKKSGAWLAREIGRVDIRQPGGVSRMSMSRWLRETESIPEDRAEQIDRVLDLTKRSR